MSKQAAVKFRRELDSLFQKRTFWLKKAVDRDLKTKTPVFNRKERKKAIKRLQDLATECLAKDLAVKEFKNTIGKKKQWHAKKGKGWSRKKKKLHFNRWFSKHILFQNCIYIFWSRKRAIYVGRTIKGKGRPQSHFEKYWFGSVTRIDVFSTSRASEVPKLECLAIHTFNPKHNSIRGSIPKWAKKCPVCEVHKKISAELRRIFSLR